VFVEIRAKADVFWFYVHVHNVEIVKFSQALLQICFNCSGFSHDTLAASLHHKLDAVFINNEIKQKVFFDCWPHSQYGSYFLNAVLLNYLN
jgi:hypothetical protein